jgi:hypothetical protein
LSAGAPGGEAVVDRGGCRVESGAWEMAVYSWEWSEADGWPFQGDEAMDFMEWLVRRCARGDYATVESNIATILDKAAHARGRMDADLGARTVVAAALLDSVLNGTAYGYGRRRRRAWPIRYHTHGTP